MTATTHDLPLFRATPARARATDPETSHEAAASVDTSELEALVLDTLRRHPDGLTTKEMARVTGEDRVTLSPRCRPLARKGLIVEAGKRDGSIVWRLA